MCRAASALVLVLLATTATAADPGSHGLRLPAGFEVTEFAGSDLANDIYTLTIDPKGRVVVSGRGYIRRLVDDDGDGKADRAVTIADGPKDGAMGLFWEGDRLYVTGDGGLRRYRIRNDRADGPSELLRKMKTGGEHDAHAIRRGPDGRLYVLCGNNTGIDRTFATAPDTPIREPVAGCVLALSPDFRECAIVADGFRNAYDMDFNPDGALFTYDSDNERCVSLPWYEGTRFYHVRIGGHHGWQSPQRGQFWRMPPYFPDVVPPVADLGRGSPTGVACYRHVQFPPEYRGGFFLADWTFGRLWFVALERRGGTYVGRPRVFAQSVGDNGFAPTGLAVHPQTGDLYVAIGGRGTRGAVYRIRYPAGHGAIDAAEVKRLQPAPRPGQPLAADSRPKLLSCEEAIRKLGEATAPREARLLAIRSLQVALGDLTARSAHGTVWEGYSLRERAAGPETVRQAAAAVRSAFPSGDADLNRELTRTLAMIEDDDTELPARVLVPIRGSSSPVEDIHYLIILARLRGPWGDGMTERVAGALLALDRKIVATNLNRDRNWPLRIAELYAELARKHPAMHRALVKHPEFGRADHAVFARAPGIDRRRAAERFLDRALKEADYPWSAAVVEVVAALPEEQTLPLFRKLWDRGGLEDALLPQLARRPEPSDSERFLSGLKSPQLGLVRVCLDALQKLPPRREGTEALALVRCLRQLPEGREADALRERLGQHLERVSGQAGLGSDAKRWSEWFAQAYPALAPRLEGADGVDVAAWRKRLAGIDWAKGDAARGAAVYQKASCAACHSGAQALGPDLRGVAGRFSRDDLFTAIVQPSKDISPRYRTTAVALSDGKTYQGMVIYEAVDSLILQTGPATTVRVPAEKIEGRRTTDVSLMPAGLLDGLRDAEIADLYTHLKGLKN